MSRDSNQQGGRPQDGTPEITDKRAPAPIKGGRLAARQKVIGQGLQQLFNNIVEEPIPDDLVDLMNRLDRLENEAPPVSGAKQKNVKE